MMRGGVTRRQLLVRSGGVLGAGVAAGLAPGAAGAAQRSKAEPFRYSLNTSTLRGQRLSLPEEVEIAARAGYDAIEPWLACILPDVFHLYKGGSAFDGVRLLSAAAIHVIHVNDYPPTPPRETITDADRVYPGDGVAPLPALCRDLAGTGFRGALSLELFNREYWKQDALTVARTALTKTRSVVRRSLEGSL